MGRVIGVAAVCVLVLASASAHASPKPAGLWVSFGAHYRLSTLQREWGGFFALNLPLERFAAPRMVRAEPGLAEPPPKKEAAPVPLAPPPVPPATAPTPAPRANPVSPLLARRTVYRALSTSGYLLARARLASLSGRARGSAALPELGLRTLHSNGQTLRLTPTSDDPYRYTQAGTSDLLFEARLTWHLDRLIFADEEVSIERLQNDRDAAERRLVDRVLEVLGHFQHGRKLAADPLADPEVREAAELEAIGALVELDVLTGGWFSQAIGESESAPVAGAGESARVEVDTPRHAR